MTVIQKLCDVMGVKCTVWMVSDTEVGSTAAWQCHWVTATSH